MGRVIGESVACGFFAVIAVGGGWVLVRDWWHGREERAWCRDQEAALLRLSDTISPPLPQHFVAPEEEPTESEEDRQIRRWAQTLGCYASDAVRISRLPEVEPERTLPWA